MDDQFLAFVYMNLQLPSTFSLGRCYCGLLIYLATWLEELSSTALRVRMLLMLMLQ